MKNFFLSTATLLGILVMPSFGLGQSNSVTLETELDGSTTLRIVGTTDRDRTRVFANRNGVVVDHNGQRTTYAEMIDQISYEGLQGNDRFVNDTLIKTEAFGGSGNDYLRSDGEALLFGENGNDDLFGSDFADTISGGLGEDLIFSYGDNDIIDGGEDDDVIYSGDGDDTVAGGTGDDTIFGQNGADILSGEDGEDVLYGGSGDDQLIGGGADDKLYGNADNDSLFGGNGEDDLFGQSGSDFLCGDDGDDKLRGNSGADELRGGNGDDDLNGGAGTDVEDQDGVCEDSVTAESEVRLTVDVALMLETDLGLELIESAPF